MRTFLLLFSLTFAVIAYGLDLQEANDKAQIILAQAKKNVCPCEVFAWAEHVLDSMKYKPFAHRIINGVAPMKAMLKPDTNGKVMMRGFSSKQPDGELYHMLINEPDGNEAVFLAQNQDKHRELYCLMNLVNEDKLGLRAVFFITMPPGQPMTIEQMNREKMVNACMMIYNHFMQKAKEDATS